MARTQPPKQPEPAEIPRRGRASSVGGGASQTAHAAFARAGFSDPSLVTRWSEIAGPEISRIARPLRFQEKTGILTLLAEPGAALFLGHDSRHLAERINAYLGRPAVTKVKFVQGALSQPPPRSKPAKPGTEAKDDDPVHKYRGPDALKTALESLARWRS
ncbi:MAG TPA: DciA family protein [Rhizomicrobium sp.]|nr:DciA family protein [Rhizomicrobium sp.]